MPYVQIGSIALPLPLVFLCPMGIETLSLNVRWPEHESDHPYPSTTALPPFFHTPSRCGAYANLQLPLYFRLQANAGIAGT
jgi:hypothetical protein